MPPGGRSRWPRLGGGALLGPLLEGLAGHLFGGLLAGRGRSAPRPGSGDGGGWIEGAALASLGAALGSKGGAPPGGAGGAAGKGPDGPEERILVSAVAVEGGTPELRELAEGMLALRPNFAYTLSEVQSEVDRVFSTGYFKAVTPLAEDTRDGIAFRLVLEENETLQGVVVTGASVLPAKAIEDESQHLIGRTFSSREFNRVCTGLDQWYRDRGYFAQLQDDIELKGGIAHVNVAEARVGKVTVKFRDSEGQEAVGKTKPHVVLREMATKEGQVLNVKQAKADIDAIMAMGIFDDVTIQPVELPESTAKEPRLNINVNLVERKTGGFSAGGGVSAQQTGDSGLPAFIGSCSYSQRNLFGLNQKFSASVEMGTTDSLFRIYHTDPWVRGDPSRTSRTISLQNTKSSGNAVHGKAVDSQSEEPGAEGGVNIGRHLFGLEYCRPLAAGWSGTGGIQWQRSRVMDEQGGTLRTDAYGGPLTFSGGEHDEMAVALLRTVHTGQASQLVLSMEQALPLTREWLNFNRLRVRASRTLQAGPARLTLAGNGGAIVGDLPPYEAFPIGGTNSVRGYGEGGVGSGRNYMTGSAELHVPLVAPLEGCLFCDYGSDLDSGASVLGDPAGVRGKPGNGYGYGGGVCIDSPVGPFRLEYAWNDKHVGRFHFGIGSG